MYTESFFLPRVMWATFRAETLQAEGNMPETLNP